MRLHETHKIPRNPTRPHGVPREPTETPQSWILHPRKTRFFTRVKNPWNPTESYENPRNPTKTHGIPRQPTEPHNHVFYSRGKKVFHPGENPTKTHGIPRTLTESHENPRNPTIVDFIFRFFPDEKLTKPTESHENPRSPMKPHGIPRSWISYVYMLFYTIGVRHSN